MQRLFHPMTAEALLCEEAMPGGGIQERSLLSYGLGDGSVINMEMRVGGVCVCSFFRSMSVSPCDWESGTKRGPNIRFVYRRRGRPIDTTASD